MRGGKTTAGLQRKCIAGVFTFASLILVWCSPIVAGNPADTALQGKLVVEKSSVTLLESDGKTVHLTSDRPSISGTLSDSRLSGRELKVAGQFRIDGSFEVHEFFVVHGKDLYRIIYYCEVCNITTFSPGNCVCCQAPTVPVEVLPTDPRVYHEEIKGPPKTPRE